MYDIHETFRENSYIQYSRNIIWEYFREVHKELFPNIPGMHHGNVQRIFHEHIFTQWAEWPYQIIKKIP